MMGLLDLANEFQRIILDDVGPSRDLDDVDNFVSRSDMNTQNTFRASSNATRDARINI